MNLDPEKSLRSLVFDWFRDHPSEAYKRSNHKLYEAFDAKTKEDKALLTDYKSGYLQDKKDNEAREKQNTREAKKKRLLPAKDPGFESFCRWFSIPAYRGMFQWQRDHHQATWKYKYEMTLVPRDHGKSIIYVDKYEWAMQYKEVDVLLLGWTVRRKEIARYVYNFFMMYDEIEQDRQTSPFHFRLKNGGRFDCFLITSKETLGMHSEGELDRFSNMSTEEWDEFKSLFDVDIDVDGERGFTEKELKDYVKSRQKTNRKLWISIDDPIDITFRKERWKEETLEMHFNSTLYGIHPWKWSFTGTHKFEDDFFDFIKAKFGKDLAIFQRSTRNPDGSLLCPERFTHPDLPTYELDLRGKKTDLAQVRAHVGEYAWHSEYEQNPHPVAGEVWSSIAYEDRTNDPIHINYDLCFITIDRATTTNQTSDFTGCLIGLREQQTGMRLITHDLTEKIPIDKLLIEINEFVGHFSKQYSNFLILLIVEKQGGGDDFCRLARAMRAFIKEDGSVVKNVIPECASIIEIHNTGEKLQRIKDRLGAPLTNKRIKFLRQLRHSEIVKEILDFPHSAKVDAIDALANSEFELLSYPVGQHGTHIDDLILAYQQQQKKEEYEEFKDSAKLLDEILSNSYQRRSIFDD